MIISAPAAFSSDAFALSGIIGADALIIPKKAPLVKVETVFEQRIIASYLFILFPDKNAESCAAHFSFWLT